MTSPNLGQSSESKEPVELPLPPLLLSAVQRESSYTPPLRRGTVCHTSGGWGCLFFAGTQNGLGPSPSCWGQGTLVWLLMLESWKGFVPHWPLLLLLWLERVSGSDFICACQQFWFWSATEFKSGYRRQKKNQTGNSLLHCPLSTEFYTSTPAILSLSSDSCFFVHVS